MAPVSPKQPEEKETDQFDGVELQTEKLSHPTANRAKPPHRRPPSGLATGVHVSDRLFESLLYFNNFWQKCEHYRSEELHNGRLTEAGITDNL